jgi:hypothetical protein
LVLRDLKGVLEVGLAAEVADFVKIIGEKDCYSEASTPSLINRLN